GLRHQPVEDGADADEGDAVGALVPHAGQQFGPQPRIEVVAEIAVGRTEIVQLHQELALFPANRGFSSMCMLRRHDGKPNQSNETKSTAPVIAVAMARSSAMSESSRKSGRATTSTAVIARAATSGGIRARPSRAGAAPIATFSSQT